HADSGAEWRAVDAGGRARPAASTGGAARGMTASLGEYTRLHRGERHELADHALPPRPRPHSTTPPPQGISLKAQRILHLQDLDRRVPGVRHADVHARRSGGAVARPLATPDRLLMGAVTRPHARPPPPPDILCRPPPLR